MAFSLGEVRRRCHTVAAHATRVSINASTLDDYAAALAPMLTAPPRSGAHDTYHGAPQEVVAYVLVLDAINFGSGYSPWIRNKRDNSLYNTVASGLRERFESRGPLRAEELATLTLAELREFIPIDGDTAIAQELLGRFTAALNELGQFTLRHFAGDFTGIVRAAQGSVEGLVGVLTEMRSFDDVASYHGLAVPFYKRAQLTAADLWMRLRDGPYGDFRDIDALTAFADNVVPHVLRTDKVLEYDSDLARLVANREPVAAGSIDEIEIRAGAITAVDSIVRVLRRAWPKVNDLAVDVFLWTRGHEPAYAGEPRHITRTIFY